MSIKKIFSFILSLTLIGACLPEGIAFADGDADKNKQRMVYIHALGENPAEMSNVSTVYRDETAEVYFAIDNPNKGRYDAENDIHQDPEYDLNGYKVTICYDPNFFELKNPQSPIDYKVPDSEMSGSGGDGLDTPPEDKGYYPVENTSGDTGDGYKYATATVLLNGDYFPNKRDDQTVYNLCKLPLKPINSGVTDIYIDMSGGERSLELYSKNKSTNPNEQTFKVSASNGGWHTINIKEREAPSAPKANPPKGSYTSVQNVTLSAEQGCTVMWSTNGTDFVPYDGNSITIESTQTIYCYAERNGKRSRTVEYEYKILPKKPCLFLNNTETELPMPNEYNSTGGPFAVYASDKEYFGKIENDTEIFYTFTRISAENIVETENPYDGWVKVNKATGQKILIDKNVTVRLVTKKLEEYSEVAEYYFGMRPSDPKITADESKNKIDVELSCDTVGAEIRYTLDGSDPRINGIPYENIKITLRKDAVVRAVAIYDGIYSENVVSEHFILSEIDDFGVDAFYPSGIYEGSVNVTLTANNPERDIQYKYEGGEWIDYTNTLPIVKNTKITARTGKDGVWNEDEKTFDTFTYEIKPKPPEFAPQTRQFLNSGMVSVYCTEESTKDTTFNLFYTKDGSDPRTSEDRISAGEHADIEITGYTVIKAVIYKDNTTYSTVVTHTYDVVSKKPVKPIMTLESGSYTHEIQDGKDFETEFIPTGEDIYYTISYDGAWQPDPVPNTLGTIQYDENPIEVKGHTIIKAIAVNEFGVSSDVGLFEYIVVPEAPKAAPSAKISGNKLPVVPVSAVCADEDCYIKYTAYDENGKSYTNSFECTDGIFYIDMKTGNAYKDEACSENKLLGTKNEAVFTGNTARLEIKSELNGVESLEKEYYYRLIDDVLVAPYADKDTGEYEEIVVEGDDNDNYYLLYVDLHSLDSSTEIQYRLNNSGDWITYSGSPIKIKDDTVLQIRNVKDGKISAIVSYVYNFVPLAPIITKQSGRYDAPVETEIKYDDRTPADKIKNNYTIYFRANGESDDAVYYRQYKITHTMSLKAYVEEEKADGTVKVSKNTIHYYIIDQESSASGKVDVSDPYNKTRISASELSKGDYAKGIKLFTLTQNQNATIHYSYKYTLKGATDEVEINDMVYNNVPITVNPSMTGITIEAWLEDENGRIKNSDLNHSIEFVHLEKPKTDLGESGQYSLNSEYKIENAYPDDDNIFIYYTFSNSNDESNDSWKKYEGEKFKLTEATSLKARYVSVCGKCKVDNKEDCMNPVYGEIGEYNYTVPTIQYVGGGGGGGSHTIDKTRTYTKDIFGNEHSTHISYIKGYPDGSVKPDGKITREEMTSVLYRITSHEYEKPFIADGSKFADVTSDRWSAHDIEYMADKEIITGYPDGEFKPQNNLTRAEFASLIYRFAGLKTVDSQNPFDDLDEEHWAYKNILSLVHSGLIDGYEDGTFRPENEITRAEVMTVVNKILGRNPLDSYVKTLKFEPYTDLETDSWYYSAVIEATVTHDYYINDKSVEIKWENWK